MILSQVRPLILEIWDLFFIRCVWWWHTGQEKTWYSGLVPPAGDTKGLIATQIMSRKTLTNWPVVRMVQSSYARLLLQNWYVYHFNTYMYHLCALVSSHIKIQKTRDQPCVWLQPQDPRVKHTGILQSMVHCQIHQSVPHPLWQYWFQLAALHQLQAWLSRSRCILHLWQLHNLSSCQDSIHEAMISFVCGHRHHTWFICIGMCFA